MRISELGELPKDLLIATSFVQNLLHILLGNRLIPIASEAQIPKHLGGHGVLELNHELRHAVAPSQTVSASVADYILPDCHLRVTPFVEQETLRSGHRNVYALHQERVSRTRQ